MWQEIYQYTANRYFAYLYWRNSMGQRMVEMYPIGLNSHKDGTFIIHYPDGSHERGVTVPYDYSIMVDADWPQYEDQLKNGRPVRFSM